MRVVGYAWDADIHCVDCTRIALEQGAIKAEWAVRLDEHGLPEIMRDREGNRVWPLFDIGMDAEKAYCADCGTRLME